jgi:hypothetical protein
MFIAIIKELVDQAGTLIDLCTEFYSVLHTCFGSLFQPSSGRKTGS